MSNKLWNYFGLFLLVLSFTGCSDMIQSLRQENDAVDRQADHDRESSPNSYADDAAPAPRARTLSGLSANNTDKYDTGVRRSYNRKLASVPANVDEDASATPDSGTSPEHRVRREDFLDKNSNENSLWDAQGQNNYLFTNNRRREQGDLVAVNIERELRREIQYQLWMTLPPEDRQVRRPASDSVNSVASAPANGSADPNASRPADASKGGTEKGKDAAEEAAKTNLASTGKEDDLVRMEVTENVGNGLVRLVGQKRVIYHGIAHIIEVTALTNAKDIDDQNHLKSSAFLDMQSQVIQ